MVHFPYKVEQEWIIGTVCRNAYELISVAAGKGESLPQDAVTVTKSSDTPLIFAVSLKGASGTVESTLPFSGSIWNSESYVPFCQAAGTALHFTPPTTFGPAHGTPVHLLLDFTEKTILAESNRVSDWLTKEPVNPDAQEQAALILGTLGLKESSGWFWSTEEVCNHISAHLAVARYLRPGPLGQTGQLADCVQGLLTATKTLCAKQLDQLSAGMPSADLVAWITAGRLRNTRDWTAVTKPETAPPLVQVEYFRTVAEAVTCEKAISWLQGAGLQNRVDWARIVTASQYSVQAGHMFALPSIDGERQNMAALFPDKYSGNMPIPALNELPEDVFTSSQIQVISSGMWAQFFQRHLLHAYEETYDFVADKWGLPKDQVAQFDAHIENNCTGLNLYPYAKLRIAVLGQGHPNTAECQAAFDQHPEIGYPWILKMKGDPGLNTDAVLKWYSPAIPFGTTYWAGQRLESTQRAGVPITGDYIESLYAIAPLNFAIAWQKVHMLGGAKPSLDQVQSVMGPLLKYYLPAIQLAFDSPYISDEDALAMAESTAKIDPSWYWSVAYYDGKLLRIEKEAEAYQAYHDQVTDKVAVSAGMKWLVNYYYEHDQKDKALAIATECAEVYSYAGLETMMDLQERMGNLQEAESYGSKIKERYDDAGPLSAFYSRQIAKGNTSYQAALDNVSQALFPNGITHVTFSSFSGPPKDGIQLSEQTPSMTANGVTTSQIIVALDGIQVHNLKQYTYVRKLSESPYMQLIVWDGSQYKQIPVNLPGRLFGTELLDYTGN